MEISAVWLLPSHGRKGKPGTLAPKANIIAVMAARNSGSVNSQMASSRLVFLGVVAADDVDPMVGLKAKSDNCENPKVSALQRTPTRASYRVFSSATSTIMPGYIFSRMVQVLHSPNTTFADQDFGFSTGAANRQTLKLSSLIKSVCGNLLNLHVLASPAAPGRGTHPSAEGL